MSLWKAENTLCNIRNVGRRLDSSRLIRPVRRAFRGCGRPRDIHKGIEKMNRRKFLSCAVLAATAGATGGAMAMGTASGYNVVGFAALYGPLGEVLVNPYGIAPLTAIIKNGGYELLDAEVRVVPKKGGQEIAYKVSRSQLLTHGGVPVFGLYADYQNQVEVTAKKRFKGQVETVKFTYTIYAGPITGIPSGAPHEKSLMFKANVKTVSKKFADRLYFVNNLGTPNAQTMRTIWNNPMGGAMTWQFPPKTVIIDTKGEIRWFLDYRDLWKPEDPYSNGVMMGFHQNPDGCLTFGFGQRYAKYDLMGRKIWNRRLPNAYADFSHALDPAQNGHYFLRVSSADLRRADEKRVHTVRDVIIEVDQNGTVVDEWRLFDILDPYRSDVIKALDQGAVCLNIDPSKSGHTLSAEELAKQEAEGEFGDIAGVGPGRNWAHVNSVDYDPTDDSIIISSRHQSACIKIGRDKKVKWILGAPKGWRSPWKEALLTPVSAKGQKLNCTDVECTDTDFDWTYTQHTAFRVDEKSDKRYCMISVFDNGDARNLDQPALASMKYSRAVIYKIDQKNMTVEQVWEYGKERGHDWYSPVTSLTRYEADKDSVMVYSATAGMDFSLSGGSSTPPRPILNEFEWGAKEPAVEIQMSPGSGYRAFPISVKKAFTEN